MQQYAAQSVSQCQSVDTREECKWGRSHVWSHFSSTNSQEGACDVCGKKVNIRGNTTNLVKRLRSNHNAEYKASMMRRTEEERTAVSCAAARARQMSVAESFGGTEHYLGIIQV